MKLSEFDYTLPQGLIAQYPAEERDACRLMVLDRASGAISHKRFTDIAGYFGECDCLVLNDTKVVQARLFGRRKTGGRVEIFLLEKKNPTCEALLRPSGRLKEGEIVELDSGDTAEILTRGHCGRIVRFSRSLDEILHSAGHTPLPPYISRQDEASDRINYQTIYARREGATAAPTAGLHFTKALLDALESRGVKIAYVTLHTSYGTFAPVKSEDVESHKMHKEHFELSGESAEIINDTKKMGGKIFAVGTTATRVLEHCAIQDSGYRLPVTGNSGLTGLFIYPGYEFTIVDRLITNFHFPKSTLILLASAFAGRDFILEAYRKAIEERYRFFSYGDAMLII